MRRLEELPNLPPATPFLMVALVFTVWVVFRIRILRRHPARQTEACGEASGPGWLRTLSSKAWAMPVLATVALLLVVAIVVTFLV